MICADIVIVEYTKAPFDFLGAEVRKKLFKAKFNKRKISITESMKAMLCLCCVRYQTKHRFPFI